MTWADGPVRFTLKPAGGQGQPYGDDVVAQARLLVEGTAMTQKEIGAAIGVSHMSICRLARAGGWIRPSDAALPRGAFSQRPRTRERYALRTWPWRRLAEAEVLIRRLEEQVGTIAGLEQAIAIVLDALDLQGMRPGPST